MNGMNNGRIKKGETREDGKIFWGYVKGSKEYWVTKEMFDSLNLNKQKKSKEYYIKNKKDIHEKRKKRIESNRDKYSKIWRENRKKNIERLNNYAKEYYKNNKEKVAAANKKWRKENWGRMSALLAQYRIKKRWQTPELSENQKKIISVFFDQANRLGKTLGIPFELDHIIPISKGGTHEPSNLQVIPRRINRNKHNKKIFIWAKM